MALLKKQISKSKLANIILSVILVLVIVFGYFYLMKTSPTEVASNLAALTEIKPKFLYNIVGPSNKLLSLPRSTYIYNNEIYVCDTGNSRVVVFDYNGRYRRSFGTGKMVGPFSLTVVRNEIYVADPGAKNLQVYNMDGKFLRYFAKMNVVRPVSITYDTDRFYVVDVVAQQVIILNNDGKILGTIGKGPGDGILFFPNTVAIHNGKVYVADTDNSLIKVFSSDGKQVTVWPLDEQGKVQLMSAPRGLGMDKAGNLFIAEGMGNDVVIISPKGKIASRFTSADDKIGDNLGIPIDTTVDQNGRLYVTDLSQRRVSVYSIR